MEFKRILFVLNQKSGPTEDDYQDLIQEYFSVFPDFSIEIYKIDWENNPKGTIKNIILEKDIEAVIASGGDGTVRFVAELLYGMDIVMGILPTGSANGLAKNLNLPQDIRESLDVIKEGHILPVSSLTVNDKFCIHLADVGLNAAIVKRFEEQKTRGFYGYLKAFKAVYFKQKKVRAIITADGQKIHNYFYMLVFCNGTGYGTGLAINPGGKLDDFKFEIVQVKRLSFLEGLRLYWGKDKPSPDYVKISSCREVTVELSRDVHIQVDGEYLGKTNRVEAKMNQKFLQMLVPANEV